MQLKTSVHTHTTFCDGRDTPAAMAAAAAGLGLQVLGFSGHSLVRREDFGIPPDRLPAYRAEIGRLRDAYAGRLQILCGLEVDTEAPQMELDGLDYLIGSAHAVRDPKGSWWTVDATPELFARGVKEGFGGDALALAEAYYDQLCEYVLALRPTLVGHFDLIRKFNAGDRFFEERGARYRALASAALARLLDAGLVLEVNTGAISRGWRQDPYPADFLLRQALQAGGRVAVTADAHAAKDLTFYFDEALDLLRRLGFGQVLELTAAGWKERAL